MAGFIKIEETFNNLYELFTQCESEYTFSCTMGDKDEAELYGADCYAISRVMGCLDSLKNDGYKYASRIRLSALVWSMIRELEIEMYKIEDLDPIIFIERRIDALKNIRSYVNNDVEYFADAEEIFE